MTTKLRSKPSLIEQPKKTYLDVVRTSGNIQRFGIAWSKYFDLFCKIKEKDNNPPRLIPKDTNLPLREIEIPESLKGKVGFNHEIDPYYLEAKGFLSKIEEKEFEVLCWRQEYGEEEWVDHNTPEPSRFTQSEIESIDREFDEVLVELDRLWNEIKPYINMDVCRFLYRPRLTTKGKLAAYEIMGGSSAIEPYEVTDYKSCKSLLRSYSYEKRNTDEFRNTNYNPEGFYSRVLFPAAEKPNYELKKTFVESVKEVADSEASNAKKNLSKGLEYIRWDDNEEKFYAKAKGKDREEQNPLKLTSQSYGIFQCLFNKYDPKTKKASVPIDTVLYEARIKDHKKGDNISKDKKNHLSSKITPIKDELEDAGFEKDRIKIDNDYCELFIECRYDI